MRAGTPAGAQRDLKSQQTQAQVNPLNSALALPSGEQPGRGGKSFILCDFLCQVGLHSPGRTAAVHTGKHNTGISTRLCLREKISWRPRSMPSISLSNPHQISNGSQDTFSLPVITTGPLSCLLFCM